MFHLIVGLTFCFVGTTIFDYSNQNSMVFGVISIIIGLIFLTVGICITIEERKIQFNNEEKLIKANRGLIFLQEKIDVLMEEFKLHLLSYSKIEADIFDKITPKNTSVVMVKYPKLKSSKVLIHLTNSISDLQSEIYDAKMRKESILCELRSRPRNPWLIPYCVPEYIEKENN